MGGIKGMPINERVWWVRENVGYIPAYQKLTRIMQIDIEEVCQIRASAGANCSGCIYYSFCRGDHRSTRYFKKEG